MAASTTPTSTEPRGKTHELTQDVPGGKKKKRGIGRTFRKFLSLSKSDKKPGSPSQTEQSSTSSTQLDESLDPQPFPVASDQIPTLSDLSQVNIPVDTAKKLVIFVKLLSTYTRVLHEMAITTDETPASPRFPFSPRVYLNDVIKNSDLKLEDNIRTLIASKGVLHLPQWMISVQQRSDLMNEVSQYDENSLAIREFSVLDCIYKNFTSEEQAKIESFDFFSLPMKDASESDESGSTDSQEDFSSIDGESSSQSE
jgi:hypothetical protein